MRPAAPSPPAQAAGDDGGKRAGARTRPVTAGMAVVQPGPDQNQPLPGMEASQQPPPASGISPGHRCSWQGTGGTARAWLQLKSAPGAQERSVVQRCPSARSEGPRLLGTAEADRQPHGGAMPTPRGSPPWGGEGASAPRAQDEQAEPHGPSPNCCSHFQAGESGKNVGQREQACLLSALINKTWREGNQSCPLGCRRLCLRQLHGRNSQAVPPGPSGHQPRRCSSSRIQVLLPQHRGGLIYSSASPSCSSPARRSGTTSCCAMCRAARRAAGRAGPGAGSRLTCIPPAMMPGGEGTPRVGNPSSNLPRGHAAEPSSGTEARPSCTPLPGRRGRTPVFRRSDPNG